MAAAVADAAALVALVEAATAEPRIESTYVLVVASEPADGAESPVTEAPVMVPPVTVAVLVIVPDKVAPAMLGVVIVLFVSV